MDPNVNYNRQIELAKRIQYAEDNGHRMNLEWASELASLVIELAIWVNSGGFVPKRFER
jgi:hypothetical protein